MQNKHQLDPNTLIKAFESLNPLLKHNLHLQATMLDNDQDGTFTQTFLVKLNDNDPNDALIDAFSEITNTFNWDLFLNTINGPGQLPDSYDADYQFHWRNQYHTFGFGCNLWLCQSSDEQVAGIFNILDSDCSIYITYTVNSL